MYPLNNRGLSKHKLGWNELAIEDYSQAIALDPACSDAFANRATARYDLSQYQEALEDFDRALVLEPNNSEVANALRIAQFMIESEITIKDCAEA